MSIDDINGLLKNANSISVLTLCYWQTSSEFKNIAYSNWLFHIFSQYIFWSFKLIREDEKWLQQGCLVGNRDSLPYFPNGTVIIEIMEWNRMLKFLGSLIAFLFIEYCLWKKCHWKVKFAVVMPKNAFLLAVRLHCMHCASFSST